MLSITSDEFNISIFSPSFILIISGKAVSDLALK